MASVLCTGMAAVALVIGVALDEGRGASEPASAGTVAMWPGESGSVEKEAGAGVAVAADNGGKGSDKSESVGGRPGVASGATDAAEWMAYRAGWAEQFRQVAGLPGIRAKWPDFAGKRPGSAAGSDGHGTVSPESVAVAVGATDVGAEGTDATDATVTTGTVEASGAAVSGETDPMAEASGTEEPKLIVALGDSIALGIGDGDGGGFVERIRRELEAFQPTGYRVANLAVNGMRSDQLLKRLDKANVRETVADAGMMFVSIGGNDLMRVVKKHFLSLTVERFAESMADFEGHLSQILDALREMNPSADIYILGIFNPLAAWFEDIPELAGIMADWNRTIEVAADRMEHVYFVPVEDLFGEDSPDVTAEDFVHPNEAGYNRIAERVLEVIGYPDAVGKMEG